MTTMFNKSLVLILLGSMGTWQSSMAVELLTGFGGTRGYGDLAMLPNDDGSSNRLNLPFSINYFGTDYNSFWVNNNGNVSFRSPISTFTPRAFPVSSQPMIAPWWADVDTRGGAAAGYPEGSNSVWIGSPDPNTVAITWDNVGYYQSATDKINDFQLVLRNRSDIASGDFDVEFRYRQLQWTTGDASGGQNGLGGIPAQAGYDAGNNQNFLTLPSSFTNDVLTLADNTNVTGGSPGFYLFEIRNGCLPGDCFENPLIPIINSETWNFNFNISLNQTIFIDPAVAVGYDYFVNSGPNIASFRLPSFGDNLYDLYTQDQTGNWVLAANNLLGGTDFNFADGGVSSFRILGIEISANLNPNDPTAFVTALTFTGPGTVNMNMTPIAAVPIPGAALLMLSGLGVFSRLRGSNRQERTNLG